MTDDFKRWCLETSTDLDFDVFSLRLVSFGALRAERRLGICACTSLPHPSSCRDPNSQGYVRQEKGEKKALFFPIDHIKGLSMLSI